MNTRIQTYTGDYFDILNCEGYRFKIHDIAHALSNLCRFTGHTEFHYSVAQHSLLASELVSQEHQLAALLHDASEAYLTDIPSPFKPLFPRYLELEEKVMQLIAKQYGFTYPLAQEVKRADQVMLLTEKSALLGKTALDEELWTIEGVKPASFKIAELNPSYIERMFLDRFLELS